MASSPFEMLPRLFQTRFLLSLWLLGILTAQAESPAGDKPESATALLAAVHSDQTDRANALLETGVDPNATNRYGITALFLACQNGNEELVKALLEAGADPNLALPGGETPLMTASRTGKPGPVSLLLESGARVDTTEPGGQDALLWATAEGHSEVVSLLIDAGADPDRKLESDLTPLLIAARDGHRKVVEILLAAGADVEHATEQPKRRRGAAPQGTSALRLAVENGHFELAVTLLEAGADPNDQRSGFSALHVLTWVRKPSRGDGESGLPAPRGSGSLGSLEFVRILIEDHGAEVDLALKSGSRGGSRFGTKKATPFLFAARTADLAYLKLLHELGADPSLTNENGSNALHAISGVGSYAPEEEAGTEADRLAALQWIRPFFDDLDVTNRNRETAMHGAAYKNAPGIAKWLHEQGADIAKWNQKNRKGWTPLLIAQGFRPGNFKPSFETIDAIEEIMRSEGVEPPPAPKRPVVGKPKKYEP